MIATALLLLVPLAAPPTDTPAKEATVAGRTVAEWVADLASKDSAKARDAYDALIKAGPNAKSAVPALVKLLDSKTKQNHDAIAILGAIGPDAKDAVPALLAQLPKETGSFGYGAESIAVALAKIDGPKLEATRALLLSSGKGIPILLSVSQTLREYPAQVVPQLITLCGDKDMTVRMHAATVLGELKEKPIQKVPVKSVFERAGDATKGIPAALEKLLADENADVRFAAARAVTHVAPELTDKALPVVVALAVEGVTTKKGAPSAGEVFHPVPEQAAKVLIPLFDHANDGVRWWAINHCSQLATREAIEAALKDGKTARLRAGAAMTLGARYGSGDASIPALTKALTDNEISVRFAAAVAIVRVSLRNPEATGTAVPVLIEALQSKDEQMRIEASQTLLAAGAAAKPALPTLKKLLDDEKPEVRLEAGLALVGLDPKGAADAVPALVGGLKLADSAAIRAAKALAELGPVAKDAVPELVKKFTATNLHLRLYAAEAAGRIDPAQGPKAAEVLVGLLTQTKQKSSMIRLYSLTALIHIGPAAKDAFPTLTELLKDDGPFHTDVALAMIAIDPEGAKPALDWIRKVLLKGDKDEDSYELAERLPNLGPRAKLLTPDLIKLLESKTPYFRESAVLTLAAIGPDAKAALPELKKLAESEPRPKIRKLAADAIKKIDGK